MGIGTPRVAGPAGHIRLYKNGCGGPADAAGAVPAGLPPGTHGQGHGTGPRRHETAEGHRLGVQPVRQYHRGHRRREGRRTYLPLDI